jgi:Arc/MetJ-type ribon-helix-helix transcriptional regulator
MEITLNPFLEKYVQDLIKDGLFNSPQEVLEAGLARMMLDPLPGDLDEQQLKDLQVSLAQADRGEFINASVVHAEIRRKYIEKQK